jgi:hypothetical protein
LFCKFSGQLMKIPPQLVYEYLLNMRRRPVMWASTQEGFVNPILLLLNMIGIYSWDITKVRNSSALEVFSYNSRNATKKITDEFCVQFVDEVVNYLVQDVMES